MKPPKRSPFLHSRHSELLHVYRSLYPDPHRDFDPAERHHALSTVQLWINRSACPFAVETTALLVQSVILDEHMQQIASSTFVEASSPRYALEQMGGGAELGVRLNYSLALTRFVNSVVDSHQTGGFAQSIAAIAARIGLPLWFVEIRHAATHEELPSIGVCRQAVGSALAWLHCHFWVPQLFEGPNALPVGRGQNDAEAMDVDRPESSSAAQASIGGPSTSKATTTEEDEQEASRRKERRKALSDLRHTLKDYRSLAKRVTRDRSLINKSKDEFRRLFKQLAGFVLRVRTLEPGYAAQLIDNVQKKGEEVDVRSGGAMMDPDEVDECTKAALADLVNELVQPGGLIPLSRSKRVADEGGEMSLPTDVAGLWTPLLVYLRDTFGTVFGQILVEELVDIVVRPSAAHRDPLSAAEDDSSDPSSQSWKIAALASAGYRATAEAWIRYLVSTVPPAGFASGLSAGRAPTTLVGEVEVAEMCLPFRSARSVGLLEFLCERSDELQRKIGPLVSVLQVSTFVAAEVDASTESVRQAGQDGSGFDSHLEVMQERLRDMQELADERGLEKEQEQVAAVEARMDVAEDPRVGQQLPIGWRMADASWKPTPFGCLDGKIPDLCV